jgi:WD40 repeat protein
MLRTSTALAGSETLWRLAWSPDGKQFATWGRTVRLWSCDAAGIWQPGQVLTDDMYNVYSVAWHPLANKRQLATGWGDGTVRLWSCDAAEQWQLGQVLRDHNITCAVFSMAWSPDGRYLASGAGDNTVGLRSCDATGQWQLRQVLEGHTATVRSVAWSPDGRYLASCSDDQTARLWLFNDAAGQWQLGQVLTGHTSWVWNMAWSSDGKHLAFGLFDRTLRLWSCDDKGQWQPGQVHKNKVTSVVWSPLARNWQLASALDAMGVRLWSCNTEGQWRSQRMVYHHAGHVTTMTWSPDGTKLAVCFVDNTVQVWLMRKYDDRTHKLFPPAFRAWIAVLMCLYDRNCAQMPLEMWLIVFQQMAALVD